MKLHLEGDPYRMVKNFCRGHIGHFFHTGTWGVRHHFGWPLEAQIPGHGTGAPPLQMAGPGFEQAGLWAPWMPPKKPWPYLYGKALVTPLFSS